MTKTIEVSINKHFMQESEEEIKQFFGMGLPDKIQLVLTDALVEKMKTIQNLMEEHRLTSIHTLSGYHHHPDDSHAIFYKEGMPMELSTYTDFDKKFDTVEVKHFDLECTRFYKNQFKATFLYTSASCRELAVETDYFDINN